jgi:hypothetical protein
MKVEITKPPRLIADGSLQGTVSEQGGASAMIVIEMNVSGVPEPVHVTLDPADLAMIVRLAKNSKVQAIRDAVT